MLKNVHPNGEMIAPTQKREGTSSMKYASVVMQPNAENAIKSDFLYANEKQILGMLEGGFFFKNLRCAVLCSLLGS